MPRTIFLTAAHHRPDEAGAAAASVPDCRVLLTGGPAGIGDSWLLADGEVPAEGDRVTVTYLGRRHHFEFTGDAVGTRPVFKWIYVTTVAE
ncbi:DUF5988 family protein [Streptomyces sp. cmx-4-9]|uniref:DUF5988 family protein n=1 Tax=Streptomyces sp. cmx-4-9 TaxID=2790941 RepID=UPI003980EF1C